MTGRQRALRRLCGLTAGLLICGAAGAQRIGPSTATEPYVVPARPGVATTSILTTGDAVGGYRMVGVPDGLGAWAEDALTFHLVMNHEIGRAAGVTRAHGSRGAFVSRWHIERGLLRVISGRDHLTGPGDVMTWSDGRYAVGTTAFDRFCSADLASTTAYAFDGRLGTPHRIFLSGEETAPRYSADHGRLFAHVLTGPEMNRSYELPRLGRMSFENALASPFAQARTVVVLKDDAGRDTRVSVASVCRTAGQLLCTQPPSELFVYVGTKQDRGSTIERAGLTNGRFYGVKVAGATGEHRDFVFASTAPAVTSARFALHDFGDVSSRSGVDLQDEAIGHGVTQFMRIEDGAWDPRPGRERDYYFVTTGRIAASASTWLPSRLWRVRFDDIARPELGGTIEMLLSSAFHADNVNDPGYQMFDNLAVDRFGRVILQEDVGGSARLGRIYAYGIDSGKLELVAHANPRFFTPGEPGYLTSDEESSAIIDASHLLGDGWYLMTVQSHAKSPDAELVQGGQLVAIYIDPVIARE